MPDRITILQGEPLHILLRWDATADADGVWRTRGRQRFEAADAPEDDVYDQLMDEAPTRVYNNDNLLSYDADPA